MAETPQQALARLIADRGESLSALSRMIGRNVAYLQQYVARGSPRTLPERERGLLARYLGVDEGVLGAPARQDADVPYLDIAAAAGAGIASDGERVRRRVPVARDTLRAAGVAAGHASIIDVRGDSMAPTLCDGDRLIVDTAARAIVDGGVFVIRLDGLLAVKRLSRVAGGVAIASDNPDYPARIEPVGAVTLVGRARMLVRTL